MSYYFSSSIESECEKVQNRTESQHSLLKVIASFKPKVQNKYSQNVLYATKRFSSFFKITNPLTGHSLGHLIFTIQLVVMSGYTLPNSGKNPRSYIRKHLSPWQLSAAAA